MTYKGFEIQLERQTCEFFLVDDNGLMHVVEENGAEVIGNIYENPELSEDNSNAR